MGGIKSDKMSDMKDRDSKDEKLEWLAALEKFLCATEHSRWENEDSFKKLQQANNMRKVAYQDMMTMALEAKTRIEVLPDLEDSVEHHLKVLQGKSVLDELIVECSIEHAIVPVAPEILVSMVLDVEKWALTFCHIVSCATSSIPIGVLGQLNRENHGILNVQMVNAEFHLPTPVVKNRKSYFMRWQREATPGVWVILDLSHDYLPYYPSDCKVDSNYWKKSSGVIIRESGDNSEIIWIENAGGMQYNSYGPIMNLDGAFSARHWVNVLLWKLRRDESRIFNAKLYVDESVIPPLLKSAESMKRAYLEGVNETPDRRKWVILYEDGEGIRILRDREENTNDMWGLNSYIAVSSYRVHAEAWSLINFLVKKNLEIQWQNALIPEEHEELVRLAVDEDTNCISVYGNTSIKPCKHLSKNLLQEVSKDNICSFIVCAPFNQLTDIVSYGTATPCSPQPSGFAIIPDVQSDVCLVTIAMHREFGIMEIGHIIKSMCRLIKTIIEEINENFPGQGKGGK